MYERARKELARRFEENKQQRSELKRQIAKTLLRVDVEDERIAEIVSKIHTIQAQIEANNARIERWNETDKEIKRLTREINSVDRSIQNQKEQLEPHFLEIGQAAIEAHQAGRWEADSFAETLEPLDQLEGQINQTERQLDTLTNEGSKESLIGKTLARGKSLVKRGSLRTKTTQRDRHLKQLGESVCDSLPEQLAELPSVSAALAPVRENLDKIDTLRARRSELQEELERNKEAQTDIERAVGMRNPARNLSHEVTRFQAEADGLLDTLGETALSEEHRTSLEGEELEPLLTSLDSLDAGDRRLRDIDNRLKLSAEIEQTDAEIKRRAEHVKSLEQEIEAEQAAIEKLDSEKGSKTKQRGAIKTLKADLAEFDIKI